MSAGIPTARYADRISRAQAALQGRGDRALLIGVGADLQWLTGYHAHLSERLTVLVIPADAERATLIVPRLEAGTAGASSAVTANAVDVRTWHETEDPTRVVSEIVAGVPARGSCLVSDRMWGMFVLALQGALGTSELGLASSVLTELRRVKDEEEIELLRRAAHAADRSVEGIRGARLVGRSERDIAREVRQRLVDDGHDEATFAIVGSGPNSASPHHDPSDRVVRAGEPIVLDIGGHISGYNSDITRTLWVTGGITEMGPDQGFRSLYSTLQHAQAAATAAARVGTACEAVDAVARSIITDAGYGEQFIHRTGHGIGLEGHEHPYIVEGNREQLMAGDAFSIEPGIYFEGRYGARIEDIVVARDAGPDSLNRSSRDLQVVFG